MSNIPVAHTETVRAVFRLYVAMTWGITGVSSRIRILRMNVDLHCPEK